MELALTQRKTDHLKQHCFTGCLFFKTLRRQWLEEERPRSTGNQSRQVCQNAKREFRRKIREAEHEYHL